ncbi:type II secretion system secretin GspD [Lautropia mirabilis ATCC 51599]|jgi:general secretion pathway protein D|uniref:General secretion pathway protein D n=1 Tax=Lautropia mirabilis ATCC 51599 TaxID=887898 RepID=E7RWU0_9BURK|nr:type II secretion system secretin GspD [Lautropia mirabilis]EFV95194.1 general secretion pathway protein D [Lautropia mirabilis ATCC 51599]
MKLRHSSKLLAQALLVAATVPALAAPAQPPARKVTTGQINLNFKDAEVDSVIGAFGHLLNKSFVIDPRVRGKISLETPRPVNRAQAFALLKTVLRQQGFAIVDLGDLYKVVPEADAKLQSGPVEIGAASARDGDEVITQVFQLNHESANNMIPVLRPLVSPNNTITAFPGNNTLIITDYAANLKRLSKVIATLDSPRPAAEVQVVVIKNSIASDIAVAVSKLMDEGNRGGGGGPGAGSDPSQRVVVMADPRTNSVLIRSANASKLTLARSLVEQLDRPANADQANMRVVYLKNAEATKLVEVLQAVLSGESNGSSGSSDSSFGSSRSRNSGGSMFGDSGSSSSGLSSSFGDSDSSSGGGLGSQSGINRERGNQGPTSIKAGGAIIAADPATNSLIITAPEPVYRNIRGVIDQLDSRRAQVYIESLIVEVKADTVSEMGIQWQFGTSRPGQNSVVGGTNFSSGGSNILSVTQNPAALAAAGGLNVGVVRNGVSLFGQTFLNLGLLARALEAETNSNIRATPNLLTLDNEEARIIIGQNVPFVTGQYATTNNTLSSPFQTIERKDVGTMLRVRPQVSEGGTVKMEIAQEISAVVDTTQSAGIITNRRAIDSNVLVDDGQIVVLGGLIEDTVEGGISKVPLLGDIPGLGRLFRYDNRKRVKTNLLIFLRPVVLRSADQAWDVTANRYDYINQRSQDARMPTPFGMVDVKQPELDPLPPRPGTPNARRVPPAREPSLMPGAAEEAKSLGVVPANSLRAPQPDMSSLMNTAPRSRQVRRGNGEDARRSVANDGRQQPVPAVRTTGSFRSLDDAVRAQQQAARPQNATPEPVQLRNQVEVNVD